MNKQFEDMLKESEIKNQERKRAKKRKKIAAKVSKRSGNVVDKLEHLLLIKESGWHDDDYDYGKDW